VNAFEVLGPILILWAALVTILGLRSENFPGSQTAERVVGAISVLLVMLAIGAAIYTSSHEHKKGEAALPSLPA
jgi:formate-dependent nitrite reductase membrane component NrfD